MYWEVNAQRKPRVYVLRLVYTVEEDRPVGSDPIEYCAN